MSPLNHKIENQRHYLALRGITRITSKLVAIIANPFDAFMNIFRTSETRILEAIPVACVFLVLDFIPGKLVVTFKVTAAYFPQVMNA